MDETNDQRSNTAHVASGVQQSCSKTSVVSTDIEQLKFFSGNPHVESTTGVLHFRKNKSALDSMGEECCTVCMVEIPAHFSCFELLRQMHLAFIRNIMACPFNSLEDSFCTVLFVEKLETPENGAKLAVDASSESSTCAVCLEKMEDGVLTILCNHSFHFKCLQQWEDSTCPVCRFNQTPELIPDQTCSECGKTTDLWMCLICGNIGCGRYAGAHAYIHFENTSHTFTKSLGQDLVWDYAGDNFVHRLIQSSIDGKMVELQGIDGPKSEENEINEIEVAQLFSSQMETQRLFFENKIKEIKDKYLQLEKSSISSAIRVRELEKNLASTSGECNELQKRLAAVELEKTHLDKKCQKSQQIIRKMQSELEEERQMSKMLAEDKQVLTAKNVELEKLRVSEIKSLEEQVSDLMAHFEAQKQLSNQISNASVTEDELQQGNVVLEKTPKKGHKRR
ncbi:hypothetical protein M3Y97_00570100 [Aphelenchoides bicaudatus]|nr:hypothetical protein M3Y97_00570100 [Aphelenchoides bicaudatus]